MLSTVTCKALEVKERVTRKGSMPHVSTNLSLTDLHLDKHCTTQESLYGCVTIGHHRETSMPVAVKMSKASLVDMKCSRRGHTVQESPLEEARILAQLPAHPQLAAYRGSGCTKNGYYYIITEYCNQGELFELLANPSGQEQPDGLSVSRAKQIFLDVCNATAHCHKNGVVHLDLSLENVMLHEGTAKIIDFGMARTFEQQNSVYPGSHRLIGKEAYCSPEIFTGKAFDGTKSDVWSLGIVLFMMLSGTKPIKYPHARDSRYPLLVEKLPMLIESWQLTHKFDSQAIDLLQHIFCAEPQRYNIFQVLNHPFCHPAKPKPSLRVLIPPATVEHPHPIKRRSSSAPTRQLRSSELDRMLASTSTTTAGAQDTDSPRRFKIPRSSQTQKLWSKFKSMFSSRRLKERQMMHASVQHLMHRQVTQQDDDEPGVASDVEEELLLC